MEIFMQGYPIYQPQNQKMVEGLFRTAPTCVLITGQDPGSTGLYNPLYLNGCLYLHLHHQDAQLAQLEKTGRGTLLFYHYHGFVPSYAKDDSNASFATMFYTYAEVEASSRIVEDDHEARLLLEHFMKRYQPEGGYKPLADTIYDDSVAMIRIVAFQPKQILCKWKLGQNRNSEQRLQAWSFLR